MNNNIDKNSYPTAGQLERNISQRLSTLYGNQVGHRPSKVDCHLFGNKLVISLENVITPVEKLLLETKSSNLEVNIRTLIDGTIKPKLKELVEEIFQVGVTLCLYETSIDADYAGAIIVLEDKPKTRVAKSSLKRR
ncbi:MAG: DUF2294 domain-containing protein [Pleurocapsa sp.]